MAAPLPHDANGPDSNYYSNLEVVHNAPGTTLQIDHTSFAHAKFQPVPVTSYVGAEPKAWIEHDPSSPPTARDEGYAPEAVPFPVYYHHPGAGAPPGGNGYHSELHDSPLPAPPPPPTICGIARKKFWILAGVIALIVVAAAVGGGVGGALSNRSESESAQQTESGANNGTSGFNTGSGSGSGTGSGSGSGNTKTPSVAAVQDMSIAAIGWESTTGVKQYRVYHQPANQSNLFESKWDSAEKTWQLSQITQSISEPVKKGSPLTAVVGYPHGNSTLYKLHKTVYYQQPGGVLMERNSEDTFPEKWGQAGFSTRASAFANSSLHAYLYTNLTDPQVILTVFYQESGAGSLTISRFAEKAGGITSNWTPIKQTTIDIAAGSPIAAASVGRPQQIRLYITKADGTLTHHPYDIDRNVLDEAVDSDVKLPPKTPLCVFTEDNRNKFTPETLPSCARGDSGAYLTHLILHATPDRKSLGLLVWDCADGFRADQSRIENLLKPNRVYLAVSAAIPATGNAFDGQRAYVLYDEGKGPLLEEWEIPAEQGKEWKVLGSVPLYVSSTPA